MVMAELLLVLKVAWGLQKIKNKIEFELRSNLGLKLKFRFKIVVAKLFLSLAVTQ